MNEEVHDGFWLPEGIRDRVVRDADWVTVRLSGGSLGEEAQGRSAATGAAGAGGTPAAAACAAPGVAVRWPRLSASGWSDLLAALRAARRVGGDEAAERWQAALRQVMARLTADLPERLPLLSAATGYAPEMLVASLTGGDLVDPGSLRPALDFRPGWGAASAWVRHPSLGGRVRFFPHGLLGRVRTAAGGDAPLFRPAPRTGLAVCFAAGNVPGTALVLALMGSLANHADAAGALAPAVLVRNSRHEPLFTPWVLTAVERVDPDLVAAVAVTAWDYEDLTLQGRLLRSAGLLLAAADDGTIASLDALREREAPRLRFHRHGHKVSFAVLGRDWATHPEAPRLAALDSCFWDQNGCLSARVHFVEGDAPAYAEALVVEMRALAAELPRGTTPARLTHRAFDGFAALAGDGAVRLCSSYDDQFAVALDGRAWRPESLRRAVNACQGRVVVVRPVRDMMDVPVLLGALPPGNLQSLSVLAAKDRVEPLAAAAGARGVTAVRAIGRGAFPQLAWSWDGLLPADVCCVRPGGRFTSIEPDLLGPVEERS